MDSVFLHIGMPRTATTFMQRKLFPALGMHVVSLPMSHYHPEMHRLLVQDESLYHADEVHTELRKLIKGDTIISNENFAGQSLYMANSNRTRTAKRLSEAFPEAQVIVFLRNQLDLMRSHYAIALAANESVSPEEFIWQGRKGYTGHGDDWQEYALYNTYKAREHLEGYLYKELLSLYHSLFDKVHVFLYEDLQANPERIVSTLSKVMGVSDADGISDLIKPREKLNSSMGNRQAKLMRGVNKFHEVAEGSKPLEAMYYRSKRFIEKRVSSASEIQFSEQLESQIKEYFKTNNEEVNVLYPDLHLSDYKDEYFLD